MEVGADCNGGVALLFQHNNVAAGKSQPAGTDRPQIRHCAQYTHATAPITTRSTLTSAFIPPVTCRLTAEADMARERVLDFKAATSMEYALALLTCRCAVLLVI